MIAKEIFISCRPQHWIKNLFVFAAIVFSKNIFNLSLLEKTVVAFISFCLLSSSLYILNDLKDLEEDKRHPLKSKRPLASGRLEKSYAIYSFAALGFSGLILSASLNWAFFLISLVFFILQVAYSFWLKHVVILDVFVIAAGFLIRIVAGGLAIKVTLSSWLLICSTLLALFLALSKRRHELVFLEKKASEHRPILEEYSPYFLDQLIAVVTASIVVAYCLYTISEETVAKFGTANLLFTVPFVLYGIFRYLYLIHQKVEGGSPETLIIKDKPLLIDIFLWIVSAVLILYKK